MYEFEVIEAGDGAWEDVISAMDIFDFHHTSCFHQLEVNAGEHAILCVGYYEGETIALPLIIREIPGSTFLDATSVYGYCGPVASCDFDELEIEHITGFQKSVLELCDSMRIISVFSRLHPLINASNFFKNFGSLRHLNKTVFIDLNLSLEEQRKGYRKSNKSEINQLRGKKGYSVIEADSDDQIREFVSIYTETMNRVDARSGYFYNFEYFKALLDNPCFKAKLLLAIKNNVITAGAIFTVTDFIMQYHLAGTKGEFISDTPMKLILDEARLLGNKLGLQSLHLGGGVGGSDEDSLFKFKSGFSKNFCQFSAWSLVVNREAYNNLVKMRGVDLELVGDFFPAYRAV